RQEAEAEEQSRQEEEDKQKAEEEEERRKAEEERQRKAERYRQEAAEWRRQEEERQRAGIQERNNGIKWMFLGGLIGILLIGGICVLLFKNQISGYVTRVLESRQSSEDKSQGEITEIPTENIVIITEADLPDSGAAPENMFLSESEAQEETVLQEETIPQAGTPGQPETAALVETLTWKELSNATITDSRNVRQYSDSDEVRDNLGILYEPYNSFEMSAQDDEPAYLVVYNGEQFASMGGMIAVLDTTAADTTASGWMEIYADDELIYASDEEITCTTRPQNFGVDISGSEWITIRVVQREGGSGDLNIFLTSVRLDITDELVLEGYSNEIPQSKGDTSFYKDGTPVPLNGYILPDSNERYLSESDLSNLTLKGLCYAKNEIYARLGRKFKAAELREYFGKQAWYNGIYEPTDENDAMLVSRMNDYEYRNKDVLSAMEQKIGPYDVK
ncbi:MAG: YARHG domain-containing protein, partial [Lachnospiraceae bacterium]|nr:YARHG domain-containing protein [Lachnospiraceae bacterium]